MILGIDASNIRDGGGLTHLKELISEADATLFGFIKVIVWSNVATLNELPDRKWLIKKTHPWLNKTNIFSFFFQFFVISMQAKTFKCDLIFVPGGTFLGSFKNIVLMSQNMLPFEKAERNRFPFKQRIKFRILKFLQSYSFKKSKGVIFLTNYAKDYISKSIDIQNDKIIIPHGINLSFTSKPKIQHNINFYSDLKPFKLLYVSIVTVYKHQWNIAEAVLRLRKEGYPITLQLVGSSTKESLKRLMKVLQNDDKNVISYNGLIPYEKLNSVYKNADAFIFASSCENMPIILLEAMTSGLPIVCSERGPMPEVLGDGGVYFNPINVDEIYDKIKKTLESPNLRKEMALISYNASINYTWQQCSKRTFDYLFKIAKQYST